MAWTDERVELLKELWGKGLSASQIAVQLGGVSRNAVIGKAHRLGLESRPSPIRGSGSGSRPRRSRGARRTLEATTLRGTIAREELEEISNLPEPPPGECVEAPRPTSATRRAIASNGATCVWPIGDPGDDDFSFCEAPALEGRPYCADHCAVAYIRKDRTAA
jgi:GcrA cell cycle regulator